MEEWRVLLYPLGLLSALVFGGRFVVQWLQSEREGKSVVTSLFWKLSLIGNISLALHAFIQVQFHVCFIQACSAVISWRNLNLMKQSGPIHSFRTTVNLLCASGCFVICAFIVQGMLSDHHELWFRVPPSPWRAQVVPVSVGWHLIGFLGYALFSSRFWIQWWMAEKKQESYLPISFWWLSLIGAILSCFYFLSIHDVVNMIGPLIGLVPYIRNLMLIYKAKSPSPAS